jgi:flagellar protein FliS
VSAYARNSQLAAYRTVAVQGAVDNADPHAMVQILMDGIMDRLAKSRGCIERRELMEKSKLLHSCVVLLSELRGSLNMAEGGELAERLGSLYDYMVRRLLLANLNSDAAIVMEVSSLMGEIRGAWIAIGPEVRQSSPQAASGGTSGAAGR